MDFTMNRRSFLRGAAALGAAAAAGLSLETAAMAEEAAPTTDRIVIGRRADSDDLDPVMCIGNHNIFIFNLIIEGLIMTSDDGNTIVYHFTEAIAVFSSFTEPPETLQL